MYIYINKGYGWVGWKNGQKPVSIKFTFNSTVHVNNITVAVLHNPDLGIQVNSFTHLSYQYILPYTYIHIWTVYNVHIINEIFIIFT